MADELERLAAAIKPALDEQVAAAEQQAVQAAKAAQVAQAKTAAKDAETQAAAHKQPGFQPDDVHKLVGLLYVAQVFGGQVADVPTEVTAAVKSLDGKVSQQQLGAMANIGAALTAPEGEYASHKVRWFFALTTPFYHYSLGCTGNVSAQRGVCPACVERG